jgi:menaquinone-9 beta-reductase
MSQGTWDAAVIGGGPAGCSAAISLAERGWRVALFESQTYPHDKLCGEFLSPECAGPLAALGVLDRVMAENPVRIHTARITTPEGTTWQENLPGTALGISRKTLDALLAERAREAGAVVFEATTVDAVTGSLRDGFELATRSRGKRTAHKARAVIGAQGRRSAVDRVLGRRFFARRHPFVALKAHFWGPAVPEQIRLHTFTGGYCGISEIEGGARVLCLLVREDVFHKFGGKKSADAFIQWMQDQNPALQSWLQEAERIHERWIAIAQVPFVNKPVVEGDILMAGDAAGLIAPLAGNGITMALSAGRLSAGFLSCFLAGEIERAELCGSYKSTWKKQFGLRLRLGRALQPLMFNPKAARTALQVLNLLPWAGRLLVTHTRGPVINGTDLPKMNDSADRGIERRNRSL